MAGGMDVQNVGAQKAGVERVAPVDEELAKELEQRQAFAVSQVDYHRDGLTKWERVAQACSQGLMSLHEPQSAPEGTFRG